MKDITLGKMEMIEFFESQTDWDEGLLVRLEKEEVIDREFMQWLADISARIAKEHPHVEIIAYAERWHSFPRGSVLCTDSYSGHNFAGVPKNAAMIASNLLFYAGQHIPVSLSVSFCFHTGGARFKWEKAAGVESPSPIHVDPRDEGEVVWTPEQALQWAKKNWRSNVNLPRSIEAAIHNAFGLGTKRQFTNDGEVVFSYSIPPEELEPDAYS